MLSAKRRDRVASVQHKVNGWELKIQKILIDLQLNSKDSCLCGVPLHTSHCPEVI